MNVNEFLSPQIGAGAEGLREIHPNQGQRQCTIKTLVRLLLSDALGVKKLRYVACHHMPPEVVRHGVYHIRIEGLYGGQKKFENLDPENLYPAKQIGVQFAQEYQRLYKSRIAGSINDQVSKKKKADDVEQWLRAARTLTFRAVLMSLADDRRKGIDMSRPATRVELMTN